MEPCRDVLVEVDVVALLGITVIVVVRGGALLLDVCHGVQGREKSRGGSAISGRSRARLYSSKTGHPETIQEPRHMTTWRDHRSSLWSAVWPENWFTVIRFDVRPEDGLMHQKKKVDGEIFVDPEGVGLCGGQVC